MYHAALPARRKAVAGLLLSMALTAFLTGVTEPIEFTFVFLAPVLYAVHALLTGIAMVVMDLAKVRLGFSFSAGLFDYVLGFGRATRPLLLLPIGIVYSLVYYGLFRYCIAKFDLKTPGRDLAEAGAAPELSLGSGNERARALVAALGGAQNLSSVDACTTRLRLVLVDANAVDGDALKRLGARGTVRPSAKELQVILGPIADQVAGEMRAVLRAPQPESASAVELLAALGGAANVREVAVSSTRLCFTVVDDSAVRENALGELDVRGVARPRTNSVHVLIGPTANTLLESVRGLVKRTTTS
jgi:PTS system N-acetylglucosamine-specific IIC component